MNRHWVPSVAPELTPVFSTLVNQVLNSAQDAKERLSTVRTGIDRLHAPDHYERCPVCREAWPCSTRRLVDGLSRGELDVTTSLRLVDEVLEQEVLDLDRAEGGWTDAAAVELSQARPAGRPTPAMPTFADLLDTRRTGRALDLLFGG